MTEARVPRLPVDEAKAAADEAGVPDYMAELAIFQVLLNHPRLACALNDLLAIMLWRGTLDPRLRELVIMRIGWLTASDYEWTQHWRVAQGLGVSADDPVVEFTKAAGALADVVVDVTAYRAALDLLASGRYPFASLPRRCVGLDDAEDLLATMAGERDDVPPVHGVLTP